MEKIIKKISHFLSLAVIFCFSAVIYFDYKGFVYENGTLTLQRQIAAAGELNMSVLDDNLAINAPTQNALGSSDAPLTMYEYSSFDCPHCADFHLDMVPRLKEDYVDKSLLRIVFVSFPLSKISMNAALLSQCVTPDNYHSFVNEVFSRQFLWRWDKDSAYLIKIAEKFGISHDEAEKCLKDDARAKTIISDRQEAISRLKIQGTPAFYITGKGRNEIIYGMPKYDKLKTYLDKRLGINEDGTVNE